MPRGPTIRPFPPLWVRIVVSSLIAFHFLLLLVSYSGNWRKSETKGQIIETLQPYLIGLNWYVEIFPIEWEQGAPTGGGVTRLLLGQANRESTVLFRSDSNRSDRERERQFLGVLATLAEVGEDDGTSLILESILRKAEKDFQQTFTSLSLERKSSDDSTFQRIYFANIVRLDGAIRFVPAIESQRTVLSLAKEEAPTP